MGDENQGCILKDYVAIVGSSQDFGVLYSLVQHLRQLGRAALNNLSGLEQIFQVARCPLGIHKVEDG